MKKLLSILLIAGFLAGGVFLGYATQPSAYKINLGDARWHTKLNAGLDALWDFDTSIAVIVSNWVGIQSYQTATYVGASSFSVVGDLTSKYSVGQLLLLNQGVGGLVANTVVSSSYGAGVTTVIVTTANVVATLGQAQILNPTSSEVVVASDYGTNQAALIAADVVAAAAGKQLVIGRTYSIASTPANPLTANLKVLPGGTISIANGATLTINGSMDAGLYQIFSCTGTGKVVLGAGAAKEVYPEWWVTNGNPGTTDMTTAIQAAGSSIIAVGGVIKFLSTSYLVSAAIDLTSSKTISFAGNGYDITRIYQTTNNDFIHFISSSTGRLIVSDLSIYSTLIMTTGAAIRCIGGGVALDKSLMVHNVLIQSSNNTSNYEFKYGIYADACTGATISNTVIAGAATTPTLIGLYITDASGVSTAGHVYNLYVGNAAYGVKIACDASPGVEGWYFDGCDFLTTVGIYAKATAYYPPQLVISTCHFNGPSPNIYIEHYSQIFVNNCLIYNSDAVGTGAAIDIVGVPGINVHHNKVVNISGGVSIGIRLTSADAVGVIQGIVDHNDLFSLSSTVPAIKLVKTGAGAFYYLTVRDNISGAGAVPIYHASVTDLTTTRLDSFLDMSSAAIVGFSSFTTKEIYYKVTDDDMVLVVFNLAGPSDSTSTNFILPFMPAATPAYYRVGNVMVVDNSVGLTTPGIVSINGSDNHAYIYKDCSGAAWTASGNKSVQGEIWYRRVLP